MNDTRYKLDDFELYKAAREYRIKIYRLIRQLPSQEKYCLDPQMRRAAVSMTNNIAEGHGRWHYRENIQYCRVARGSIEEIIDDLNVCHDEGYVEEECVVRLKEEGYALIKRVNGYISYLKKNRQGTES
jgi:four helix bundle protein